MSTPKIFTGATRDRTGIAGLCFVIVLAACGGGSTSNSPPSPPLPPDPLSLSPTSATVDAGMTQKFAASGGVPPYTFTITAGQGTMDASGGTFTAPTSSGTATIKVADSSGSSMTAQVTVDPRLTLTPGSATVTAGTGRSVQFVAGGGSGGYKFSVASGSGTIDANGLYTTGNTAGTDIVQVTDSVGGITPASILVVRIRTNGPVESMVTDGSAIYLGGSFTAVNPYLTPRAAVLDPTLGKPIPECDLGTGFDAAVNASVVVGNSLYVGGAFTNYNGQPAHGIAKLDVSTCALDTTFTQAQGLSGFLDSWSGAPVPTTALALASNGSALYVGGNFNQYRGVAANGFIKIDPQSGALDSTFTQSTGPNHLVNVISASADWVFFSGEFNQYRGAVVPNGRFAPLKVSATTGDMDPGFVPPQSDRVVALLQSAGSIYVAGSLHAPVQKLDVATGTSDPVFAQGLATTSITGVGSIAISGSSLYLASAFTNTSGFPVSGVSKVDALTGVLDPSFSQATVTDQGQTVTGISVLGNSLYIVGSFAQFAGQPAPGLAKIDASSGALDPQFGLKPGFEQYSTQSIVATPSAVYVTGTMSTYGGVPAHNIAKLDAVTGVADTKFLSAPGPDAAVSKLLLSGSSLFAGGQFTHYGNLPIAGLAKVDPGTGIADSQFIQGIGFEADFNVNRGVPANVTSLAIKGDALYVGGLFATYGGQPVVALAKLDMNSGVLDTSFTQASQFTALWSPISLIPLEVTALALSSDSLYVAGNFVQYRGAPQKLVAKIDPITGALDPAFAPITSPTPDAIQYNSTMVNALLISGNNLYIGSAPLTLAGGVSSSGLAKVDVSTGVPDASFCQAITLSTFSALTPAVRDLALIGSSLYAAGNFAHPVGSSGAYAQNLAKFDSAGGGIDTTFSQPNGPNGTVTSLSLDGSLLDINGTFSGYRGTVSPYSIGVDPANGAREK
ncbi:MAG: delta-60 repeat domain-containing protein [Proteobacteria bacterium]|nr:delta-60 repeat domain-containing protein [Pseudomonadota bacterium]